MYVYGMAALPWLKQVLSYSFLFKLTFTRALYVRNRYRLRCYFDSF